MVLAKQVSLAFSRYTCSTSHHRTKDHLDLPRQRKRFSSGFKRNRQHALTALRSSLAELSHSIRNIEILDNISSRTTSAIIRRILIDELPKAKLKQQQLEMRSYLIGGKEDRSPFPLTILEVTDRGSRVVPIFLHNSEFFKTTTLHKWKNQICFSGKEASSYYDLFKKGVLSDEQSPLDDLSRELFISDTRNEVGAHYDDDISLFSLFGDDMSEEFNLRVTNGPIVPSDVKLHKWNRLSATIATIGYEIIKSIYVVEHQGELVLVNHTGEIKQP